jgi:hypothetical protein
MRVGCGGWVCIKVCEVLGEGPLTYEKLDELEYCRAVMNEVGVE